jgi:hypothetical protein
MLVRAFKTTQVTALTGPNAGNEKRHIGCLRLLLPTFFVW